MFPEGHESLGVAGEFYIMVVPKAGRIEYYDVDDCRPGLLPLWMVSVINTGIWKNIFIYATGKVAHVIRLY